MGNKISLLHLLFRSFQLLHRSQLWAMGLLHPLTCLVATFLRSMLELGFCLLLCKYYWMHVLIPWFLKYYNFRSSIANSLIQTQLCPSRKLPFHALLKRAQLFSRSQGILNESMPPVGRQGAHRVLLRAANTFASVTIPVRISHYEKVHNPFRL